MHRCSTMSRLDRAALPVSVHSKSEGLTQASSINIPTAQFKQTKKSAAPAAPSSSLMLVDN